MPVRRSPGTTVPRRPWPGTYCNRCLPLRYPLVGVAVTGPMYQPAQPASYSHRSARLPLPLETGEHRLLSGLGHPHPRPRTRAGAINPSLSDRSPGEEPCGVDPPKSGAGRHSNAVTLSISSHPRRVRIDKICLRAILQTHVSENALLGRCPFPALLAELSPLRSVHPSPTETPHFVPATGAAGPCRPGPSARRTLFSYNSQVCLGGAHPPALRPKNPLSPRPPPLDI